MKYKFLGKTNEKLSEIGVGTWALSGKDEDNKKAIEYAIDNGVNFIDTAEIYGTESIVGKIANEKQNIFIATKVWGTHMKYEKVIKACENSLKNLNLKQIDLYQLHFRNPGVKIKETMKAMEKLVYEGKIRYIGVSNFNKNELKAAQMAMKRYEIVSNQVEYNLIVRYPEKELINYMKQEKITLIAYSPLAHGALFRKRYRKVIDALNVIGKKYDTSPVQLMLKWLSQKDIVIPIVKASTLEHMKENIGMSDIRIKEEDIAKIDSLTPVNSNKGLSRLKMLVQLYFTLRTFL